jgi:tetratricopeptide (TPR) repeat protein
LEKAGIGSVFVGLMTPRWLRFCGAFLVLVLGTGAAFAEDVTLLRAREGAAALIRGQYDKAVAAYDEALSNPEIADFVKASIYSDRGVAKWRLKQTKEAVDDFNQSIQISPESANVYNNRGNALMDLGHPEEAMKDFDRAITLSPNYGAAYNNRGNARAALGEYEAAFQDFRKAVELMPTSAVPFNGRGKAHAALKRYHAALHDYSRALALNAKYEAAYENRGEANLTLDNFTDAADDFTQALTSKPDQPKVLLERAKSFAGDKKYNPAVDDLNKAIELKPDLVEAYLERGDVFSQVRRYDDAIADFNRAIELSPQDAKAYAMLAAVKLRKDPPEVPKPQAESVVAKQPAAGDAANAPADANAAPDGAAQPDTPASPDAGAAASPNAAVASTETANGQAAATAATPGDATAPAPTAAPEASAPAPEATAAAGAPDEGDAATPAAPAATPGADASAGAVADAGAVPSGTPGATAQDGAAAAPPVPEPAPPVEYAALTDVNQALTIAPDDPVALRIRGDIYQAMGKTDEAIADYRRSLELDPFQSESRDALVKLDQEVPQEPGQPLAPPVEDWVIKEPSPGRYVATSSKYPKVRAELEMFGAGKPKILEWSLKKDSLSGIGLLRYYAGSLGDGAGQDLVYTAIVDLWSNKVVTIEPYSWGSNEAKWDWQAYSVVVTDLDGTANEIKLRRPKPRPVARDQGGGFFNSPWGGPGGGQGRPRRGGGGGGLFGWFR